MSAKYRLVVDAKGLHAEIEISENALRYQSRTLVSAMDWLRHQLREAEELDSDALKGSCLDVGFAEPQPIYAFERL